MPALTTPAMPREMLHISVPVTVATAAREAAKQRGMGFAEFVRHALRQSSGLDAQPQHIHFAPQSADVAERLLASLASPQGIIAVSRAVRAARAQGRLD